MTHDYTPSLVRTAIQQLLNGAAPTDMPKDAGEWQHILVELTNAYATGGTTAVRRVWGALCNAHRGLAAFLAADQPEVPPTPKGIPILPKEACQIYAHKASCAQWLDDYTEFAQQAAPKSPCSLHEAAGLFAIALAIGRRLVLRVGVHNIFPNVFMLWLGATTVHGKTTALHVLRRLIAQAGLQALLLPEKLTPQALHEQMSTEVPAAWVFWSEQRQSDWLEMRGLAAQRGWAIDEASFLFDSLRRDYNAELLGLILQLYECPPETGDHTITRGHTRIREPLLNFFGVTTPESLAEHLQARRHWLDGLWARFALIAAEERRPWKFFPPAIDIPPELVAQLRHVHTLFSQPYADVIIEEANGKPRPICHVFGVEPPSEVQLADGVWQAWEVYARATQDTLLTPDLDSELHGSYGRFATQAIKIAMLLAAIDCDQLPVRIERRHFARAQEIVERWRVSLHEVWAHGVTTDEEHISNKIMKLLQDAGEQGLLARDIYRPLHRSAADITKLLEFMERSGEVERLSSIGRNGRMVERWVLRSVTGVTQLSQGTVTPESGVTASA